MTTIEDLETQLAEAIDAAAVPKDKMDAIQAQRRTLRDEAAALQPGYVKALNDIARIERRLSSLERREAQRVKIGTATEQEAARNG